MWCYTCICGDVSPHHFGVVQGPAVGIIHLREMDDTVLMPLRFGGGQRERRAREESETERERKKRLHSPAAMHQAILG